MPDSHIIRLRSPWELRPLWRITAVDGVARRTTDNLPASSRVPAPGCGCEALGPDFLGAVEYRRRFGRPSGLSVADEVWIICDGIASPGTVSLNGEELGVLAGANALSEFNVTGRLAERNDLAIVVELAANRSTETFTPSDRPASEVRLEIRTTGDPKT